MGIEEVTTEVNDQVDTSTEVATDTGTENTGTETVETAAEGTETPKIAAPAAPAYTPNYKLKVYDEEKELDDPFLKALIKDADSEKKVKEIAQKYLGFDTVKTRHEKTKTDFQNYQQQSKPILDVYNAYYQLQQKGDLEGIFELLGLDHQKIFQFAVQKAQQMQLPPEQQQEISRQRQLARERDQYANQNQTLQEQQHQQLTEFRNQELSWVLLRPEVTSVAQAFDAKNGKDSFRELVRNQALAHYASTQGKEDLTAEQAVQKVMQMIGGFVQPTNQNGQPAPQQAQLIQQNGAPPIIPNVAGRGTSPVKKQVRSLDDLKKKREELRSS